ncbi:RTA1 like protein-domain-containing protein [Mycena epipterygia]|nr:RTA1 like protein-domain-containing protein [Mycena epipterygia]
MSHLLGTLVLLACLATAFAADGQNSTTNDTASDPPIGGFVPKKAPAYIALVSFGVSAIIHFIEYFTITPRRPFMRYLLVGMISMATGFGLRIRYSNPPFTVGNYVIMDLFILLSPCLFLATDYVLLARLVATFDDEVADRCLLIRSSRIVKLFVWSDVTTFLLQSSGGSLTANKNNASLANLGNKIILVGLILQAISFVLFSCVLVVFGWRVCYQFSGAWHVQKPRPFKVFSRQPIDDWRILFYVMCITCVGITIRCIFRVSEFAGGYNGRISTHEGYFYLFDALPLWISMTLYCVVWPVRALNAHPEQMKLVPTGTRQ